MKTGFSKFVHTGLFAFLFILSVISGCNCNGGDDKPPFIPPPSVSITTTSLDNAAVGTAYDVQLGATGGSSPYTWTVSIGWLPSGLTLELDGRLWGTPATGDGGTWNFTVQAADSSTPPGTATQTLTIDVLEAAFSGSPTSGDVPLTVDFTNEAKGSVASYFWDFGDGGTSTDTDPTYIYTTDGSWTVSLTVTGSGTLSHTETKAGYIDATAAGPPSAAFSADPLSGDGPLTVTFTDESTGSVTSWEWDFDYDGVTFTVDSTAQNPTHIFMPGVPYTVSLRVTGPVPPPDTMTKTDYITVTVPPPPEADFTADPTSGDWPLLVQFYDASTNRVDSYEWDFDYDGVTFTVDSTEQNPTHTYGAEGIYTVALRVRNLGGSDTESKTDYIDVNTPLPPVAGFSAIPTSGQAPVTVTFTNESTGRITSYLWDFGDGVGTSTAESPLYTYVVSGAFTVSLTATGPGGSDTYTEIDCIIITAPNPPQADFTATPLSGDAALAVQFSDASTELVTSWSWDFDNDSVEDSNEQNPLYTYTVPATYTVALTVTNESGSDTKTRIDYIVVTTPPPPVANFTGTPTSGDWPLAVTFTNLSTNAIWYQWNFGDGVGTSTEENPVYTYTSEGTFDVTLVAIGAVVSATELKPTYITTDEPPAVADFYADPVVGEAPLTVNFYDNSTCTVTSWSWDFGDGVGTSAAPNPTYIYNNPGTYDVALVITTAADTATEIKVNYIVATAIPATPTNFYGDTPTVSSITWHWDDNCTFESGHEIQDGLGARILDAAADATSAVETGLTENTQYTRQCVAFTSLPGSEAMDQNQEMHTNEGSNYEKYWQAQSFMPATTGQLKKVEYYGNACSAGSVDFTVAVYPVSGGAPDIGAGPLAIESFSIGSTVAQWRTVTFTSPPYLVADTEYALVFDSSAAPSTDPTQGNSVWFETGEQYARGCYFVSSDWGATWTAYDGTGPYAHRDYAFRVYMLSVNRTYSDPSNTDSVYTGVHDPTSGDFSMADNGDGTVTVTVMPPAVNPTTGLTGVWIERMAEGEDWATDAVDVTGGYTTGIYFAIDDLTAELTGNYVYRISFCNGDGAPTAWSPDGLIFVITSRPDAPSNFTSTIVTTTTITWTWQDNSADEEGFYIHDILDTLVGGTTADVTSFVETGLGENAECVRHCHSRWGQSGTVIVGTGTVEKAYPIYRLYNYSRGQMLYLQSEINATGPITTISLYQCNDVSIAINNVTIYAYETDATQLTANWIGGDSGAGTEVFSGNITSLSSAGWLEFVLTTPFNYSNTSNLLISFRHQHDPWTAPYPGWYATDIIPGSVDNMSVFAYSDSSNPPTGVYLTDTRPNIRFETPGGLVLSAASNTATAYTAIHDPTTGDFTVADAGSSQVDITVTPPPNQDAGLTGVRVERALDSGFTTGTLLVQDFLATYDPTDTIPASGTFYYRIQFRNGDGVETAWSPGRVIMIVSGAPAAPNGFNFDSGSITSTSITWTWNDNSGDEDGFEMQDGSDNRIVDTAANATSYIESGLSENTATTRQVRSYYSLTAAEAVDQAQEESDSSDYYNWSSYRLAQTFTPGCSGKLTKVELYGRKYGSSSQNLQVYIYPVDGSDKPDMTAARIAEGAISTFLDQATPTWETATFASPPYLKSGTTYAMVFYSGSSSSYRNYLYYKNSNVYSGGSYHYSSNSGSSWSVYSRDFAFRVYMIPEARGYSAASGPVTVYTAVHDPTDSDFTVTYDSFGGVDIVITPPNNSDLLQTGVWVQRATDIDFTAGVVDTQTYAATYTLKDIAFSSDGIYYYRIRFRNAEGRETAWSPGKGVAVIDTLPGQPQNFSGDTPTVNSLTWHWTDNSSDEDGFELQDATHARIVDTAAGVEFVVETGLSENTAYTRHIHAFRSMYDAQSNLDQSQTNTNSGGYYYNYGSYRSAQTFKPGLSGKLEKIEFYGRRFTSSALDFEVSIYPADGSNQPDMSGAAIDSTIVLSTDLGDTAHWHTVTFASQPELVKDTVYAIVFYTPLATTDSEANYPYYYSSSSSYSRGAKFRSSDSGVTWPTQGGDFAFKTYMIGRIRGYSPASNPTTVYTAVHDPTISDFEVGLGEVYTVNPATASCGNVGANFTTYWSVSNTNTEGDGLYWKCYDFNLPENTDIELWADFDFTISGAISIASITKFRFGAKVYFTGSSSTSSGPTNDPMELETINEARVKIYNFTTTLWEDVGTDFFTNIGTAGWLSSAEAANWDQTGDTNPGNPIIREKDTGTAANYVSGTTVRFRVYMGAKTVDSTTNNDVNWIFDYVKLDVVGGSTSSVYIRVTPPPNSTAGLTGVEIQRADNIGFAGASTIQAFAANYYYIDLFPLSGTNFYRIRFRNGDGVATAYSPAQAQYVP